MTKICTLLVVFGHSVKYVYLAGGMGSVMEYIPCWWCAVNNANLCIPLAVYRGPIIIYTGVLVMAIYRAPLTFTQVSSSSFNRLVINLEIPYRLLLVLLHDKFGLLEV